MTRHLIGSGTPYEATVGYSRAVRVGPAAVVSGSTALEDGVLTGRGDAAAQAQQILANVAWALGEAGTTLADVAR